MIYFNPRPVAPPSSDASPVDGRRTDVLLAGVTARTTDPARVVGAKPAAFCGWLFQLLGARPGDEFLDVFPGSGGVTRAWVAFAGARDGS